MSEIKNNVSISISTSTFFKILVIIAILAFLYLIKEVLALIFVALILTAALDPWVSWFQRRKIPRSIAILLVYILLLAVFGTAISLIVPPITKEVSQLASNFPVYHQYINDFFNSIFPSGSSSLGELNQALPSAFAGLFDKLSGFVGGIVSFFLVMVITFYFTVEEEGLKKFLVSVIPEKYLPYLTRLISRIQARLGQWLRGQLILSVVIFTLVLIGLSILGVPYAFFLALLAGIFEIVPFIGPIVAAVPAVFFALLVSPLSALFVIILYILIQQLENHLLVPKVMSKTVGLNPLVIIIAILVGAKIGGVVGIMMAVPVAIALHIFLSDFFEKKIG